MNWSFASVASGSLAAVLLIAFVIPFTNSNTQLGSTPDLYDQSPLEASASQLAVGEMAGSNQDSGTSVTRTFESTTALNDDTTTTLPSPKANLYDEVPLAQADGSQLYSDSLGALYRITNRQPNVSGPHVEKIAVDGFDIAYSIALNTFATDATGELASDALALRQGEGWIVIENYGRLSKDQLIELAASLRF
jgi:hypothetical protein